MMKKQLAVITLLATLMAVPAFANPKFLVVSMERLFDGYYKKQEAFDRLTSVERQAREEAEERAAPVMRLQEELRELEERAENSLLSDEARESIRQEFQQKYVNYQQLLTEHQRWNQQKVTEMQQRQMQIRQNLIEEIQDVVAEIGKEEGADFVLDTSDATGGGVPAVLYVKDSFDVTEKVLSRLNRSAP